MVGIGGGKYFTTPISQKKKTLLRFFLWPRGEEGGVSKSFDTRIKAIKKQKLFLFQEGGLHSFWQRGPFQ